MAFRPRRPRAWPRASRPVSPSGWRWANEGWLTCVIRNAVWRFARASFRHGSCIRLLENPHSQTEFAWGCRPGPARFTPAQTPSAEQRNLLVARLGAANAFGSGPGPERDSPLRAASLGFAAALGRTAGQRSAHARPQVRLG